MNIFVSNQNPTQMHAGQRNPGAAWQTGDVISALLSDITGDKATLRTEDGFTFTANATNIQGQVGDTLTFQVNRNNEGFSLTQMFNRSFQETLQAERGNATLIDGYEETKELVNNVEAMKEADELRADYHKERAAKIQKLIASIRSSQTFLGRSSDSVINALIENGIDLAKVNFSDLKRIMIEIDRAPGNKISKEDLIAGMNRNWAVPENAQSIVNSLYNHGLAVSDKNVAAMENAYDRLPESVPATAIEELISKEQDLTLDNVYKSCYAYGGTAKGTEVKNPNANLLPQEAIENFFAREGIPATNDNLATARFLIERDLPLNRENIVKVQFLQGLTRAPLARDYAIAKELFFDKAAGHLASDTLIGTMRLMEVTRFAEAQLKIAMEAANRLQSLNIDIDAIREQVRSLQLNESNALKFLNEDAATRFLKMAGANAEPIATTQMTELFDAIATMKPLTANVHAGIIHGVIPFTVKGVHESVQYARAMAGYEQNATVPDPRYGDSFSKVKNQFGPLLESLGITATSENTKAAFILSKNNMDLTEEHLAQVKAIDAKISAIANTLHPMIAAHMIKDGLNPIDMQIDQVLSYIKRFNLDMGENGEDKISRYIMEMDESGTLDSDTRKAMIATYRMLNVIRRDGAAALGLAAQMEGLKAAPMTLGDLLNLAQKQKTNTNVTDAFGQLESLTRPTESIRAILETTAQTPVTYTEIVTESFIDIANPANLKSMMDTSLGQPIEDLALAGQDPQTLQEPTEQSSASAQEQIQTFVSANPEIINMLQSRGITTSAGNIRALERLSNSRRALADELEAISSEESDSSGETAAALAESLPDSSLSELREGQAPGEILAKILSSLGETRRPDVSNILAVTHGLNGDGEQGFQMPIKLNGKVTNLSLYVLNESALNSDGARVLMSLDTEGLGMVNTYFTINGSTVDINIAAESRESAEALASNRAHLEVFLAEAGATIGEFTFSISQDHAPDNAAAIPNYRPQAETAYDYRV